MPAAYQLSAGSGVVRTSDGASIPDDPTNADWQRYQAWRAAGNTPDPAPAPPNISIVTNGQLKRWLDANSKLATAKAAVVAAGGLTEELWYGASAFHITDPLLVAMATAIGMSSADLQAAFNAAASLP